MYTKIQVIKMLRDQVPGLGLKEAKDIVDGYEMKSFEDRVARALGEEARIELRQWARLFVSKENRGYGNPWPTVPTIPMVREVDDVLEELLAQEDDEDRYPLDCDCNDCNQDNYNRGY